MINGENSLLTALWAALVLLPLTFGAGWLAGRRIGRRIGRRQLLKDTRRLTDDLARNESQIREQSRQASRMRAEQRTIANFLGLLPSAVERLNSDRVDTRAIPRLIQQLASAIFEPDQILLYLVRTHEQAEETSRCLHLVTHRGLVEVPSSIDTVPFGNGKIGWVAEQQVDMMADDWHNPTKTEGIPPDDNHPALKLDLVGPLVHHTDEGRTDTLGVLCIGGATVRPRDEKLMLQMITNLGAIALTHARNVRHLSSRANHDGLTGLMNKQKFMESLGIMINDAERELQPVGVFMFDIDHFKQYNDTNGHPAGDELLKRLARVVRENLRPGDIPCRYGGEEFLVAMPDTDAAEAYQAAERIRKAIEDTTFAHGDSQPLGRLTISGGVASFPVDGTNSTELIQYADQALYRGKAAGRNRVLRFEGVQIGDVSDDEQLPTEAFDPDASGPFRRRAAGWKH